MNYVSHLTLVKCVFESVGFDTDLLEMFHEDNFYRIASGLTDLRINQIVSNFVKNSRTTNLTRETLEEKFLHNKKLTQFRHRHKCVILGNLTEFYCNFGAQVAPPSSLERRCPKLYYTLLHGFDEDRMKNYPQTITGQGMNSVILFVFIAYQMKRKILHVVDMDTDSISKTTWYMKTTRERGWTKVPNWWSLTMRFQLKIDQSGRRNRNEMRENALKQFNDKMPTLLELATYILYGTFDSKQSSGKRSILCLLDDDLLQVPAEKVDEVTGDDLDAYFEEDETSIDKKKTAESLWNTMHNQIVKSVPSWELYNSKKRKKSKAGTSNQKDENLCTTKLNMEERALFTTLKKRVNAQVSLVNPSLKKGVVASKKKSTPVEQHLAKLQVTMEQSLLLNFAEFMQQQKLLQMVAEMRRQLLDSSVPRHSELQIGSVKDDLLSQQDLHDLPRNKYFEIMNDVSFPSQEYFAMFMKMNEWLVEDNSKSITEEVKKSRFLFDQDDKRFFFHMRDCAARILTNVDQKMSPIMTQYSEQLTRIVSCNVLDNINPFEDAKSYITDETKWKEPNKERLDMLQNIFQNPLPTASPEGTGVASLPASQPAGSNVAPSGKYTISIFLLHLEFC